MYRYSSQVAAERLAHISAAHYPSPYTVRTRPPSTISPVIEKQKTNKRTINLLRFDRARRGTLPFRAVIISPLGTLQRSSHLCSSRQLNLMKGKTAESQQIIIIFPNIWASFTPFSIFSCIASTMTTSGVNTSIKLFEIPALLPDPRSNLFIYSARVY